MSHARQEGRAAASLRAGGARGEVATAAALALAAGFLVALVLGLVPPAQTGGASSGPAQADLSAPVRADE